MSLPGGSNIFREVLQEFVKPCPYEQSDDSSDDGSKSDEELFVSRKDSPRQKQKQLRVQWADESSQIPLAAEPYETHSARIFTKTVPKPILKCKPNYLIVMPQWTVRGVRRHFRIWWTNSSSSVLSVQWKCAETRLSIVISVLPGRWSLVMTTLSEPQKSWPKRWRRLTAIGKNDGRGGRIQWRYLSGARANAILSMTAIHCNTRYFCIYLHVCLCYVQPCIIRFFVFHMVLRTAIYIIIVYIVKENKSFTYKICHSVFWISYL